MRAHFSADWAFGVKGAIENIVRREYPELLRQWPTLQTFNFEGYRFGEKYFVIALRDKLSGMPAGPGELGAFPYADHPGLPPSTQNITEWLDYLTAKLSLRPEDIALVLPIYDSGKNDAAADFQLFTPDERQLWEYQLSAGIAKQKTTLQAAPAGAPAPPQHIIYNINGTNSKVNINSTDSSVNVVNEVAPELFEKLLAAINAAPAQHEKVEALGSAAKAMSATYGTSSFADKYTQFMSILADHIQVFGPVVAPFLPGLAHLVV